MGEDGSSPSPSQSRPVPAEGSSGVRSRPLQLQTKQMERNISTAVGCPAEAQEGQTALDERSAVQCLFSFTALVRQTGLRMFPVLFSALTRTLSSF